MSKFLDTALIIFFVVSLFVLLTANAETIRQIINFFGG